MLGGPEYRPCVVTRIWALTAGDQRRKAGDRREAVVEVVGHAAGQLTDRLQPLGFRQPLGDNLTFRHVDQLHNHSGGLAVGAPFDGIVDLGPGLVPVPGPERRQPRAKNLPRSDRPLGTRLHSGP